MGRGYTVEHYKHLFDLLKKEIPTITFSTDIIVGFPNETHEQFLDTLALVDYCQYDLAYTFIYSVFRGHLGGLFPPFLSDVLQLFLYGGFGDDVGPDCLRGGELRRAGAHAQRGRPLAFCREDGAGAVWSGRVGRGDVRPHRAYVADVAGHPARAVCRGGVGLHPPAATADRLCGRMKWNQP